MLFQRPHFNCHVLFGQFQRRQITNEVAKRLSFSGKAKFFCLAGIGGKVSGMVASVKGADRTLVLDGCSVACARKCMKNAGLGDFDYVVLTEMGIEKKPLNELAESDIDFCLKECLEIVGEDPFKPAKNDSNCCG